MEKLLKIRKTFRAIMIIGSIGTGFTDLMLLRYEKY